MTGKYATECLLADAAGIARAVDLLRAGGLVAIPTETVYGLAALADDDAAVANIFEAKGRPSFNPLIVHIADWAQFNLFTCPDSPVASWGAFEFDPTVQAFAEGQWPGPTTLVLPRREGAPVSSRATAGLGTVALRMPRHPVARAIIMEAGPIVAPSANRSGFISPTSAEHVLATLDGRIDLVLDGGPTLEGIESTILRLGSDGRWAELRAGPEVTSDWHPSFFNRQLNRLPATIEAPGQLASHYSPGKPVRLDADEREAGEFLIGFGTVSGDCTLSHAGDLTEAAGRLYTCLHEGAQASQARIAVASIPHEGVGIAINDRLRRAATPRG